MKRMEFILHDRKLWPTPLINLYNSVEANDSNSVLSSLIDLLTNKYERINYGYVVVGFAEHTIPKALERYSNNLSPKQPPIYYIEFLDNDEYTDFVLRWS